MEIRTDIGGCGAEIRGVQLASLSDEQFRELRQAFARHGALFFREQELHPDEHLAHAGFMLEEAGFPDWAVRAVLSHGWGICTDVEPQSDLEKMLYAIDELTGLVAASALVRPTKSVMDMNVKSVKKKWKDI